jgi:hypothetical protein
MTWVRTFGLAITLFWLISGSAVAEPVKAIGFELSATEWGRQTARVEVQNQDEYHKFIVSRAEVAFSDFEMPTRRVTVRSFIVQPTGDSSITINVPIFIPANFGGAVCRVALYDVVDTLDELYDSQKFYEKEIGFEKPVPDWITGIIDTGLQVPYFVDQSIRFDNHFGRLLALLLHRGMSTEEIAAFCQVNDNYVKSYGVNLASNKFLVRDGDVYRPAFAVIDADDREALRPEIEEIIVHISQEIKDNLPAYDSTLKALMAAGELTSDPQNMMDGGSVLHHKHPTVLGLALWETLGIDFVNEGQPFNIFDRSNHREAHMGDFMYLVVGPEKYKGKSVYYAFDNNQGRLFYTGCFKGPLDRDPVQSRFQKYPIDFDFGADIRPVVYFYSLDKCRKPLEVLTSGIPERARALREKVDSRFAELKDTEAHRGARYWCWSLVVEGVMDRLVENKVIETEDGDVFLLRQTE